MRYKLNLFLTLAMAMTFVFTSCEDEDTYAERRKTERSQISSFLNNGVQVKDTDTGEDLLNVPGGISVISESAFLANDSTTDVSKNEYVLFNSSGIYMQIVRKGSGEKLAEGSSATVICRYTEFNIAADTIQSSNNIMSYEVLPEKMICQNTYGTLTASFISGVMMSLYQSSSVPSGWLEPLRYINLGRQASSTSEIALVRLIVPSTEGQSDAMRNVYPCFYEISYQRGR